MAERVWVYIDGESHYVQSDRAWRRLRGDGASLERLRYKDRHHDPLYLVNEKAKVFWTRMMSPGFTRATYVTSSVCGSRDEMQRIKTSLRDFNLDPVVFEERKPNFAKRENLLRDKFVIEKPKQVDIALAVSMLQAAYAKTYDLCHLYTSDVDYAPLISAVRALGPEVRVFGYDDGLGNCSELLHVADQFIDLTKILDVQCELAPDEELPAERQVQ